ncbi:hypothetical protein [Dyella sp.]|uniref:hypothetical protein n=1 Tax=Dyella sp. TaxID=1869338 RepID=UPI002ED326CF
MKLQIESQALRLRIDEEELSRLLAGRTLVTLSRFAGAFTMTCTLSLGQGQGAMLSGQADVWLVVVPEKDVREHAQRLPTRDGLRYTVGEAEQAMELLFDVDVRDSARRRKKP